MSEKITGIVETCNAESSSWHIVFIPEIAQVIKSQLNLI